MHGFHALCAFLHAFSYSALLAVQIICQTTQLLQCACLPFIVTSQPSKASHATHMCIPACFFVNFIPAFFHGQSAGATPKTGDAHRIDPRKSKSGHVALRCRRESAMPAHPATARSPLFITPAMHRSFCAVAHTPRRCNHPGPWLHPHSSPQPLPADANHAHAK